MIRLSEIEDIMVTAHAVGRYRQRYRRPDDDLWTAAGEISKEVRRALKGSRVRNTKLPAYQLYRERKRQLPPGEFFVFAEDKRMAWIVKREGNTLVVVTTLSPTISVAA